MNKELAERLKSDLESGDLTGTAIALANVAEAVEALAPHPCPDCNSTDVIGPICATCNPEIKAAMDGVKVIRLGDGDWIVNHGYYGENAALFIEPAPKRGTVGVDASESGINKATVATGGCVIAISNLAAAEVLSGQLLDVIKRIGTRHGMGPIAPPSDADQSFGTLPRSVRSSEEESTTHISHERAREAAGADDAGLREILAEELEKSAQPNDLQIADLLRDKSWQPNPASTWQTILRAMRRLAQPNAELVRAEERERCARIVEKRAQELLDQKPTMSAWRMDMAKELCTRAAAIRNAGVEG